MISVASIIRDPLNNNHLGIKKFSQNELILPNNNELVLVVNETDLRTNRNTIDAFWRAAREGLIYVKNNPEESLDLLLANQDDTNFPLLREIEKQNLQFLLEEWDSQTKEFGSQNKESWQDTVEQMLEMGHIDKAPDPESLFIDITS